MLPGQVALLQVDCPRLTVQKALAEVDEAVAKVGADALALAGYREHLEGLRSSEAR